MSDSILIPHLKARLSQLRAWLGPIPPDDSDRSNRSVVQGVIRAVEDEVTFLESLLDKVPTDEVANPGDVRANPALRHYEMWILVDKVLQWREAFLDGSRPTASFFRDATWMPVVHENEHLIETLDGHMEIVTIQA